MLGRFQLHVNEYLQQLENAGFNSIRIIEESAPYEKAK